MSQSSSQTMLDEYTLTLSGRWGRKPLYEMTIRKDRNGDWRITKFMDHAEATPWLFDVGAHAAKVGVINREQAATLLEDTWGAARKTWPAHLGWQELYEQLMTQNVRVVLSDKNRKALNAPQEEDFVSVFFVPARGSRQSFKPSVIIASLRISSVA